MSTMTSATPGDLQAAQRISEWNQAHGRVIREVTAAHGEVSAAVDACGLRPTDEQVVSLQRAGAALATVAERALEGPWAGVPDYDNPRREGLEMYAKGGRKLATFDPRRDGDPAGFDGAILIRRGTEITAVTTEYTRELTARVKRHFGID